MGPGMETAREGEAQTPSDQANYHRMMEVDIAERNARRELWISLTDLTKVLTRLAGLVALQEMEKTDARRAR